MGIKKSFWLFNNSLISFAKLQESLHNLHIAFVVFGIGVISGLVLIVSAFIKNILSKEQPPKKISKKKKAINKLKCEKQSLKEEILY